ncbi:MAG: response regulator [Myxococcales bacterium]|nr:MAG: response regulator [Myxococcales bacterium]
MDPINVLLVDDEEELISAVAERLEIRGFHAVGVLSGEEALSRIRQEPFDVVVLDVKMPGEDGVEVMKRIKQIRGNLPVLLLTGHMSEETSARGLQAGAIDYIIKPINIEDLIEKIREAIAVYRKRPA